MEEGKREENLFYQPPLLLVSLSSSSSPSHSSPCQGNISSVQTEAPSLPLFADRAAVSAVVNEGLNVFFPFSLFLHNTI